MRIGFLGGGRITDSHLSSIRGLDLGFDIDVVGFYTPRKSSREAMAAKWGGRAFASPEQLIDAAPDAVYVTSPTPYHAEQAMLVSNAGIPLYLEKPVARTREEFAALSESIERSGIIHCIGVQWRYRPETARLLEIVAENPPTLAVGQWYWFTPPVRWLRQRNEGGGQVFDQQVHILDLARYVLGPVTHVFARFGESLNTRYSDFNNWDVYTLSVRFESGCIGSFSSTYRLNTAMDERVWVDFIAGDLMVRYSPAALSIWRNDKIVTVPETKNRALDVVGRDAIERAFLNAVHAGNPDGIVSSLPDVQNTMEILFAATESALSGREVEVKTKPAAGGAE